MVEQSPTEQNGNQTNNSTEQSQMAGLPQEKTILKVAQTLKIVDVAFNIWELLKASILGVVVIGAFWWLYSITNHQLPLWIPLLATISFVAGVIYNYFYIRNIAHADLGQSAYSHEASSEIEVGSDEKVSGSIAAITPTFNRAKNVFNTGVSPISHPENAMIATQSKVYFIVVPLPANDIVVDNHDTQSYYWLLARKLIRQKLDQMLSSEPLEEIVRCHPKNYAIPLNNISQVKIIRAFGVFVITDKNGKKYRYTVRNSKQDFEVVRQVFRAYL